MLLYNVSVEGGTGLRITHDLENGLRIGTRKQYRAHFYVDVVEIPYSVPLITFSYR